MNTGVKFRHSFCQKLELISNSEDLRHNQTSKYYCFERDLEIEIFRFHTDLSKTQSQWI